MRLVTEWFLSNWTLGESPTSQLRDFIANVDWDDRDLPSDERDVLLHAEAYLTGADEGFNSEDDLRTYLASNMRLHLLEVDTILVESFASNEPQSAPLESIPASSFHWEPVPES